MKILDLKSQLWVVMKVEMGDKEGNDDHTCTLITGDRLVMIGGYDDWNKDGSIWTMDLT